MLPRTLPSPRMLSLPLPTSCRGEGTVSDARHPESPEPRGRVAWWSGGGRRRICYEGTRLDLRRPFQHARNLGRSRLHPHPSQQILRRPPPLPPSHPPLRFRRLRMTNPAAPPLSPAACCLRKDRLP